ncbi:MAG: hypothetical protein ACYCSO_07025 [Cuniculiplasma sp.]
MGEINRPENNILNGCVYIRDELECSLQWNLSGYHLAFASAILSPSFLKEHECVKFITLIGFHYEGAFA